MDSNNIKFQNPIKRFLLLILRTINSFKKKYLAPPNVHLKSDLATKRTIKGIPVYLRKSYSDWVRLREMRKDIYSGNKKFIDQINKEIKPTVLLDFGANIGLSTLALCNKIPSIKTAICVEAEKENYGVLFKNTSEWNKFFTKSFNPIHGIISGKNQLMTQADNIQDGYSASGTFVFKKADINIKNTKSNITSITPVQLLEKYKLKDQLVVCKIDIEGGEQDLFDGDTSWLGNVVYLTIEIHDRFSSETWRSSAKFLQAILEQDFAIVPGIDTMFCYNRKFNFH